jgi:uncharacterized protein (DUF924 family)
MFRQGWTLMSPQDLADIERVVGFWFGPEARERWFDKDPDFDARVREALGRDHERAARGDCDHWKESARGCLALAVLLDQAPRNLYRDDPRAFACDAPALAVTRHALARGLDKKLAEGERMILYLPLEHSEALADQEDCVALMAGLDGDGKWLDFAREHRDVIARFGRFPHRNATLGRASTGEEAAFLAEPGSSFDCKTKRDADPPA